MATPNPEKLNEKEEEDGLSKDQEIFISQQNCKKAQGIIFHGVKTGNA